MSGALTYVSCTVGAHLDQQVSLMAAAGVAAIVGAGIIVNSPQQEKVSAEQQEWEKELIKGGTAEISPEEQAQNEKTQESAAKAREDLARDLGQSPLGDEEVRYDPNTGCIEFQQFMPLMIFCDIQICNAKSEEKPKQREERRAVSSDPEKYREVVLRHAQWCEIVEGKIIQTVFQSLGVTQEKFILTMQTYMPDPKVP